MHHAHDASNERGPRARAAVVPSATSAEVALLLAGIFGLLLLVLLL